MCDQNIKKRLLNGGGDDMKTQSEGIANLMDSTDKILAFLHKFKIEIFAYIDNAISVHANSCGNARVAASAQASKPDEKNSLKLAVGKFLGFEAQGKAGMVLSAIFWGIVGAVIMFAIMNPKGVSGLWGK